MSDDENELPSAPPPLARLQTDPADLRSRPRASHAESERPFVVMEEEVGGSSDGSGQRGKPALPNPSLLILLTIAVMVAYYVLNTLLPKQGVK